MPKGKTNDVSCDLGTVAVLPPRPSPFDLLGDAKPVEKSGPLFYLSKEALKRRQLDDLWKAKAATSPKSLGNVLGSEPVLTAIRKELRRTTGQNVDGAELARIIRQTVLRPECMG